ncbi:MAG: hypothetical protein KR126chlam5_00450 [Candidatus Anoxychlamydiales bacterium]|nr:hypothetical protein [Candidatus Anoxychlamydiales bacterium]
MASVSLPPRTPKEWFQAYFILPNKGLQEISATCVEMEKELGQVGVERDIGEFGSFLAKFVATSNGIEGPFTIAEAKHQDFANLYRELEKRFSKLELQERDLNLYLGKNENTDLNISNKRDFLTDKMQEMRKTRNEFLKIFNNLKFDPYNRIFQSAANIFISVPLQKISDIFKTKKNETLALASFVAITGYSVMTNTNASFLVKATVSLSLMYIGHLFSKTYYNLNAQALQPQTISFTMSPPSSPKR